MSHKKYIKYILKRCHHLSQIVVMQSKAYLKMTSNLSRMTCLLWAGLVLGGSIVVAPAKFSVADVDFQDAVRIGRAQFEWLGIVELAFCLTLLFSALLQGRARNPMLLAPAIVFACQHLFVAPALHLGTDRFFETGQRAEGHLHLIYVAMDIAKIALLIWVGMAATKATRSRQRATAGKVKSRA
ncbi:hypothetical protein [uncultured Roseobacter sp.]|uniref:hypothetical protein n=1 Tax=uncultured Roseobacter sp. TaxID=114847 RepID=UPI00261DFEB1|nr:hypothetical protein [uncultured Roseobacter sp.]